MNMNKTTYEFKSESKKIKTKTQDIE